MNRTISAFVFKFDQLNICSERQQVEICNEQIAEHNNYSSAWITFVCIFRKLDIQKMQIWSVHHKKDANQKF